MTTIHHFDHLIIGSGIAGLAAAYHLSQNRKVAVITKSAIREGSTQYAQGGIAVAMDESDRPGFHFDDTVKAGDGLCDIEAVKVLVEEGPSRVRELIKLGANFDKVGTKFDFTREAAHSKRRILHAADSTGREIEKTLGNTLAREKKVTFFSNTFCVDLIVVAGMCIGAVAKRDNRLEIFLARTVILATGGYAQAYQRNTNPAVATGDGIGLAYRVGAEIQDMEFTQFHPTALYYPKSEKCFLISEAVRGEGALLLNDNGERFMPSYHPDAELAPRDIVARAIISEIEKTSHPCVYLDLRSIDADIEVRFPGIATHCGKLGIDVTKDLIPVAPAAHYSIGGVKTDTHGETNIRGLFAAGEVASLGIHGANRLASNSLLEGLVFGYRAATRSSERDDNPPIDPEVFADIDASYSIHDHGLDIENLKTTLQKIMTKWVEIKREKTGLEAAIKAINEIKKTVSCRCATQHCLELRNMLTAALLAAQSALDRTESRGSHFRTDMPFRQDQDWQRHIIKSQSLSRDPVSV